MLKKLHNPLLACDLKFEGDEKTGEFEGYASVFDGNDAYNDTIEKGAFETTLKSSRKPLMLYQHDSGKPIGKWVELFEDEKGLRVRGEFTPGHTLASDVKALMKHGAIDGLSIGFRIPKGGAVVKDDDESDWPGRTIKQIDLVEISAVTMPADDAARIESVKSAIDEIESIRDFEKLLRDSGSFSKSQAVALASRVLRIAQRDAGADVQGKKAGLSNEFKNYIKELSK